MNTRAVGGALFAGLIFLLVQLGALALVGPFDAAGYRAVEDPADPTNSLVYVLAILVATGFMLVAFRYEFSGAVRAVVVGSGALLAWYVFSVVVPPVVVVEGLNALAVGLSVALALALVVHPEWYVVDAAGVVMGAGAAGLFGISFGLLPAIVLLGVLAVYDAISVYGTRHMLSLAEGVMDLRVPVVLVVPLSLSYSFLSDDFGDGTGSDGETAETEDEAVETDVAVSPDATEAGGATTDATDTGETVTTTPPTEGTPAGERDAFFIGLGDAVMPTVMIASAAVFSPVGSLGVAALPALNLPALTAMVGTLLGLAVLLWAVLKGRPHAGLPLLNGGAIGGYLLGSVVSGVSLLQALGV